MPIVSSAIRKAIPRNNGSKTVFMDFTDHLGKVWTESPTINAAGDENAQLAVFAARIEASLPDKEASAEQQNARASSVVTPAEYQSPAELDSKTLSLLMKIDDALEFSKTLPWFRAFEIRAGANTTARANYLGVARATYVLVETRYNQITGIASGLEADAGRVWEKGETL